MRKRTQSRECALQILYQYEMKEESLEACLANYWENHPDFSEEIRGFAELIARGTVENLAEIDKIIIKAAENWQLDRMAVIDKNILRFGTFELLYLDEIPPKVTINEAVNIAKKFSQEESGKFVNGILDRIQHSEKPRPAS